MDELSDFQGGHNIGAHLAAQSVTITAKLVCQQLESALWDTIGEEWWPKKLKITAGPSSSMLSSPKTVFVFSVYVEFRYHLYCSSYVLLATILISVWHPCCSILFCGQLQSQPWRLFLKYQIIWLLWVQIIQLNRQQWVVLLEGLQITHSTVHSYWALEMNKASCAIIMETDVSGTWHTRAPFIHTNRSFH